MNFLRKVFDFYVFSKLHVALAVWSFAEITMYQFKTEDHKVSLFIFFSTVVAYRFIVFYEPRIYFDSACKNQKHTPTKGTSALFVICLAVTLYLFFHLMTTTILCFLPFALLTFFYSVPLIPIRGTFFSLREIPGLKIFVIALTWAGMTTLLPLAGKISIGMPLVIAFFQRFLLVFVLCLPFDIRDMYRDSSKLKTIPQSFGIGNTKKTGLFVLLISGILSFFEKDTSNSNLIIQALAIVVIAIFLIKSDPKKNRYYTAFWIEGIPVFWLLLQNISFLL